MKNPPAKLVLLPCRRLFLTGMLLVGVSSSGFAQGTLIPLLTNGPTSNRINLVLLAEGYQAGQSNKFIGDALGMATNFMGAMPYSEYSNYFNAYGIFVASTNAGSNHTLTGNTNNSYFSSTYNSSGVAQLITIPPNDRDSNYSHGKGKVQTLLTNLLPQATASNRFVALVVNDTVYGGSGQPPATNDALPLAVASLGTTGNPNNDPAYYILIHESGHTFAGLADEYTYGAPTGGVTLVERPNATTQTVSNLVKWAKWFDLGVPVPTTNDPATFDGTVGLFEGAQYQTNLWYRPTYRNCIMNDINFPGGNPGQYFCPVCSEALVLAINQKVRAIDTFTPVTNALTLTATQAVIFTAAPLQPSTHSLTLQWFTNSVAVVGATNFAFTLSPQNFTNGSLAVKAQTADPTPLVRNDPGNSLASAVSWNVTIGISSLCLAAPQWLANGQFTFAVTGTAPFGFVIQASTNLADWSPAATNYLTNGAFNFTNSGGSSRFFRTITGL